ncbi:HNH endonuclease [Lactococcus insecticola]|uniref:HNH nuclease domain-containing protein n=1 Tax=Pseudolactococcus insecticola TaxID=2709158 RepID=A0A6A0B4F8_9LACT|nr:HNH endonuclease signature motif containing protein [Lactococcus insecticola]GFH40249.1 hypothetical protein Hs20B_06470 [Lactococcus insecticola]
MPRSPRKPCKFQGCPNLTDGDYCEEHKDKARKRYEKYERDPATSKRYGRAWRKIRARYVAEHPLCEMCLEEGRLTPVEHVHHIIELSVGGTNDFSNLMSVCKHHHSKIHRTRMNLKDKSAL